MCASISSPASSGESIDYEQANARCARCGAPFVCSPEGDCWCKALPPVTRDARYASCLCLACLTALAHTPAR